MSTIRFFCSEDQKEGLKTGVWKIVQDHYLKTAHPNSNADYKDEGIEVYRARMDQLMSAELCKAEDTEDGITVEFDSTEDAGCAIAENVYGTGMGYSDEGLTFLIPLFKGIVKEFPHIRFEADTECYDDWVSAENLYAYDGVTLTMDGIDVAKYELVMENGGGFFSPDEIAKKTGLSIDEIEEILSIVG